MVKTCTKGRRSLRQGHFSGSPLLDEILVSGVKKVDCLPKQHCGQDGYVSELVFRVGSIFFPLTRQLMSTVFTHRDSSNSKTNYPSKHPELNPQKVYEL